MNSIPLSTSNRWQLAGDHLLADFTWPDFAAGLRFVNAVGYIAERFEHHPDIELGYTRVRIRLTTHESGGITDKDHQLARAIDALIDE